MVAPKYGVTQTSGKGDGHPKGRSAFPIPNSGHRVRQNFVGRSKMTTSDTVQSESARFSLRSLILILVIFAVVMGWVADRATFESKKASIRGELQSTKRKLQEVRERFRHVAEDEKLDLLARIEKGIGKPVSDFPELLRPHV